NLDAGRIHSARADEISGVPMGLGPWGMARHGKAFEGLLKRCFGQEKVHKSERFEREWGDPFPLFFPSSKGRRYRGPLNVSACGRNHAEQGLLASCAAGWNMDRGESGRRWPTPLGAVYAVYSGESRKGRRRDLRPQACGLQKGDSSFRTKIAKYFINQPNGRKT
ncbi:hypothetical protein, partial [uncultured Pseudoflavonifractor sp.]|uniref:hypothetical protein n=1 Tax=uncultured Pseudoflavonifractor sp. TaxID=1221379 RepID=UPI0025EB4B6E